MTAKRIAATYALIVALAVVISYVSFREREPRNVHTLPATNPVPISLPRAVP